ncbi:hypothetical protein FJZ48_04295, partial [Candidatus Uhrbacteria bacterium]|nr:hypothetical protein [Candidatus Uhrbacteria bacterium]
MKKILSTCLSLCVASSMLFTPFFVSAQEDWASKTGLKAAGEKTGLAGYCAGGGQSCIVGIIGNLINVALGFIGIILLGLFLYAGFLWMTSGGETKKVEQAKTMIKNAVAGIVIIMASYAIATYVVTALQTVMTGKPSDDLMNPYP